jgi:coenzyme PQQ biosynthesis protein PqqD
VITANSRLTLAAKARLRLDRLTNRYLLLYPERGMILNPTAREVLLLCTGEQTVGEIVERLGCRYADQRREAIEREIIGFLDEMARRGLVQPIEP